MGDVYIYVTPRTVIGLLNRGRLSLFLDYGIGSPVLLELLAAVEKADFTSVLDIETFRKLGLCVTSNARVGNTSIANRKIMSTPVAPTDDVSAARQRIFVSTYEISGILLLHQRKSNPRVYSTRRQFCPPNLKFLPALAFFTFCANFEYLLVCIFGWNTLCLIH